MKEALKFSRERMPKKHKIRFEKNGDSLVIEVKEDI